MVVKGPGRILTPTQLGPALAWIVVEHVKQARVAMYTTAVRAQAEAVRELHNTPSAMVRKRGKSRGKPMPAPIDQSQLVRSGRAERMSNGASVEFTAPHASHVEEGTRPHTAPMEPILAWARRRVRSSGAPKGTKKKRKAGKKRKGSNIKGNRAGKKFATPGRAAGMLERAEAARKVAENAEKKAQKLAAGTWASIRKYGTEGRHFFARASKKFNKIMGEEILKRFDKIK